MNQTDSTMVLSNTVNFVHCGEGNDEPVGMRALGDARKLTVGCGRSVGWASPVAIVATADEVGKGVDSSGRLASWPTRRSRASTPASVGACFVQPACLIGGECSAVELSDALEVAWPRIRWT
jgi:hypothetical protein